MIHPIGKDEVTGSNPVISSTKKLESYMIPAFFFQKNRLNFTPFGPKGPKGVLLSGRGTPVSLPFSVQHSSMTFTEWAGRVILPSKGSQSDAVTPTSVRPISL